jgi:ribose-phosphate pyrophosphokinase
VYYKMAPGSTDCIAILAQESMYDMAKNVHGYLREKYIDDRFSCHMIPRKMFNNKELYPNLGPVSAVNVGGIPLKNKKIFLFHSLRYPIDPNNSLIELGLTIDALVRATVEDITLVLPYMCYGRQDRKDKPRVPISFKFVAKMLQMYPKVVRIITMDMHADQCQGFFDIPVDNLPGGILHSLYLRNLFNNDFSTVAPVAPDQGSAKRTQRIAQWCQSGLPMFSLDKRRGEKGIEILNFVGDKASIVGKTAILCDDEGDSGETLISGSKILLNLGAKEVYAVLTHWVGSEKDGVTAEEKFRDSPIKKVFVTNTIPRTKEYYEANPWLTLIKIDEFIAKVIYNSTLIGGSVSDQFTI